MVTFLLAWNPRRAPWRERPELMRQLASNQPAITQWGMMSKAVEPGDRLFFIRLGIPPKGIFACGSALTTSYLDSHWNETKRAQGKMTRCVDLALNELLDPDVEPIIELERLALPPFNQMHWTIQGSGVMMPGHIAESLDTLWQEHFRSARNGEYCDADPS